MTSKLIGALAVALIIRVYMAVEGWGSAGRAALSDLLGSDGPYLAVLMGYMFFKEWASTVVCSTLIIYCALFVLGRLRDRGLKHA